MACFYRRYLCRVWQERHAVASGKNGMPGALLVARLPLFGKPLHGEMVEKVDFLGS
jgi:hypothetical protein